VTAPTPGAGGPIEHLSAVTLATPNMAASLGFYRAVGFEVLYGGDDADFTSLRVGAGYLNLQHVPGARPGLWGRVIIWVDDVDRMHARCVAAGGRPEAAPADAPWGERYFHVKDPAGHEISFARPLEPR
jgi:catechol 2,3-dioxygenase-like lactoylglutathione lyase family enzyme